MNEQRRSPSQISPKLGASKSLSSFLAKFSITLYIAISGCSASKIESSQPPPSSPPVEDSSPFKDSPATGFYSCLDGVYRDRGFSFTLYPNGEYIKKDSQEKGTYTYNVDQDEIVNIQWEGVYQPWDKSLYYEAEGQKIIMMTGSQVEETQVCKLQEN